MRLGLQAVGRTKWCRVSKDPKKTVAQLQQAAGAADCNMVWPGWQVTMGARVALRNDSYTLHLLLPTKVDPLVSLMKVEKVPDSTYDMIGGLDQQIKEIKEARPHPRAVRGGSRSVHCSASVKWLSKCLSWRSGVTREHTAVWP